MQHSRSPWSLWITAVLIGLPVAYVFSSGPARILGVCEMVSPEQPVAFGNPIAVDFDLVFTDVHVSPWYQTLYGPLILVSEESWGTPLASYWSLFSVE